MSREPGDGVVLNHGLRLAFVVAVGLVFEMARGAVLPPLASVIALQLLAVPAPAPKAKMVIVLFGVMAGASMFAYLVAALTVDYAFLYAIGVGLLYLWGFALAVRPATALVGTMVLTMGIVVTAISAVSTGVAVALVVELLKSVLLGFVLIFLSHVLFPHRAPPVRRAAAAFDSSAPAIRAVLATAIILPLHLYLTAEGVASMVILLTVATMLRQPGLTQSTAYGTNYAVGNLLGGILASLAVIVVTLHEDLLMALAVTGTCALFFSYKLAQASRFAHVLLPGYVAFTLLFGLAYSSMSQQAEVAYIQRVVDITVAALYALGGVALMYPLALRLMRARNLKSPI